MKSINITSLFSLKIVFSVLFSIASGKIHSQVYGCRDPMANNYNPAATANDGSCTYNPTSYTPPVKTDPMNAALSETSGLQWAGGFLWTFNDSQGAAAIYNIDTLSSTIFQTVNLGGATNEDWEDITFDGTYFYIGDFGNNANGARNDLKIYKFPLSAIPVDYNANPTVTIPANQIEVINFIYSDQAQPPVATTSDNTKFDCEAMIVDNGQIHLFTKNWVDVNTVHYVINGLAAGTYTATPVDTLATNYLVTAADKVQDRNIIALLGYQNGAPANHYMHLLSDYSGGNYFNGNKRRIDLPNAGTMGQAEGLTFRNATYGYISNEQLFFINQKLRYFSTIDFVPLYVLPVTLKNFTVNTISSTNKISWSFNEEVKNVQIQYSSNGIDFSVLKIYNASLNDIFYNKPPSQQNYYRIRWQNKDGTIQYSNIISIKNDVQHTLDKLLIRSNGELSFNLNGTPGKYSFKLLSSDGKTLAQVKERFYVQGLNRITISKNSILNNFVYLIVYSNKHELTDFLRVEK